MPAPRLGPRHPTKRLRRVRSLINARYFHHELEGEFTRSPGGVESVTAILSGISTMWISIPGRSSVNEGPSTSDCSISKSER